LLSGLVIASRHELVHGLLATGAVKGCGTCAT
jgi:hypothetical protein